jgi:multicomponent Na+:H+ antiporter subunit C
MRLVFAFAIASLFGTGAYLLLRRDLVRVVIGFLLISQSAVLTLIASGIGRGHAPIHPLPEGEVSDPLSQAMALTAIVIGLGMTSLLLALLLRVVLAYRTRELDRMAEAEAEHAQQLERDDAPEHDQEERAAL